MFLQDEIVTAKEEEMSLQPAASQLTSQLRRGESQSVEAEFVPSLQPEPKLEPLLESKTDPTSVETEAKVTKEADAEGEMEVEGSLVLRGEASEVCSEPNSPKVSVSPQPTTSSSERQGDTKPAGEAEEGGILLEEQVSFNIEERI